MNWRPGGSSPAATSTTATDALFPPITTPTRPGDNQTLYTVQAGDTLYSVAREHGVTWEAIWEINKSSLASPEEIVVGQQLRIPQP